MCWAERDEAGMPYPPLWIKTKHVRKPLIEEYMSKHAPWLVEMTRGELLFASILGLEGDWGMCGGTDDIELGKGSGAPVCPALLSPILRAHFQPSEARPRPCRICSQLTGSATVFRGWER